MHRQTGTKKNKPQIITTCNKVICETSCFFFFKRIEKITMCIDNQIDRKCENENIESKRIFNSYMFYRK